MRYRDENGRDIDRNWLGEDILSLEETDLHTTLIYRNETGNPERLVIRDRQLVETIKRQFRHQKFVGNRMGRIAGRARYKLLTILSAILVFIAAVYFLFVPWLAERIAMKFSKEKEINLGDQMYRGMISAEKVDQHRTRVINSFYRQLDYKIDYPVHITVVKSDEVNAFAVPGGHIVVYEGILEKMKTPGELAALLGHEGSHVSLRHSLRNIFRSSARKMFLLILFGGDAGIAGFLADQADDLKGLEYSRKLETEADDNGLALMRKSGIDTHGMLDLMLLLQKAGDGQEPSALLSTHPVFESRIKNIRKQLGNDEAKANPELAKTFHELFEAY